MDNFIIDRISRSQHKLNNITKINFQSATNTLLIAHDRRITIFNYETKTNMIELTDTLGPIDQLQNTSVLLLQWLVDEQCALVVGQDGSIFTINKSGEVDVKAQNQDGIAGASLSPTQQYLYVVTNNKSLIQLNKEYDLVSQIALDQSENVLPNSPQFSWRVDGSFFSLNYQTVNGRKAVTKDIMMGTFISPAKSDPNDDGLVQSVSEKGRNAMNHLVAWQPSGGIIAGSDYLQIQNQKQHRIIFWQKNGLRHLQFLLPTNISSVQQLFWSLESSILFVRAKFNNNQNKLLVYYRANYHWFLKDSILLEADNFCWPLNSQKQKNNKLLIVSQQQFEVVEYSIRLSQKQWKQLNQQKQFKNQFHYFVDGRIILITDLSKCLMPPPMSMFKQQFDSFVLGVSKKRQNLLVITEHKVYLYDLITAKILFQSDAGQLQKERIYNVKLLTAHPLSFASGNFLYHFTDNSIKKGTQYMAQPLHYTLSTQEDGDINLQVQFQNGQLSVNDNKISEQCTSFTIYHQFLLFTVSTSDMYDKLFVINLFLDNQIIEGKTKQKLQQIQTKELLNHRLVERGSKIVCVSDGRVVFQLPRGNLQGIYPKIIMISQVKKKIATKQYKLAFEIIRTHKLDFNLIYDIDPEQFKNDIELVLNDIKRVDYINLLVSQINQNVSSQLQYVVTAKKLEQIKKDFELNAHGKKVKSICKLVSQTLRKIDKQNYILSIYTSEIRQGKLNDVLFQIKDLKQIDVEVVVPPHITNNKQNKNKLYSSQEILEFVCWLVDADAIYQAALLTYDLELAAMTARCTQKDPKQYLPYLEGLKIIENQVEFRKKICLDLKRYEVAVKQLAQGTKEQRDQSLQLIRKHKLYKHGLIIYSGKPQITDVKLLIIEQLFATGETNQAYRVSQSLGLHEKALDIAKNAMNTKKIKECLQIIYPTIQERINQANLIIEIIKDQIKNRIDLARLYAYVGKYEEAVKLYLRYNQYRKAYKYLWKVSQEFRDKEMKEGYQICCSVKKNQVIKDRKQFIQKYSRLLKVHKHKAEHGEVTNFRPRQNEDMYSEVSVNSKSQSNYTMSTTTGMRKKKDKKRSILSRNVKQGSVLQEQYLLAYIKSLQDKVEDTVKDVKLLIQHLICVNLIEEAELLRNQTRDYIETFAKYRPKSFAKIKFEELHPEAVELYFEQKKISALTIDSFNYLF